MDVILSSHSHVEADIQAQNVVAGGTLKGSITARTMTEVAEGGRVEGNIRSKALVVREGPVLRPGEHRPPGRPWWGGRFRVSGGRAADGLWESVRRTAEWYRSTLLGPTAEPDHGSVKTPGAAGISAPDEISPGPGEGSTLSGLGLGLTTDRRARRPHPYTRRTGPEGAGSSLRAQRTEPSGGASERVTWLSNRRQHQRSGRTS